MTLDQRAWCAPINLKITQDKSNENVMKLVKSSPIDKGTTVSLYQKTLSGKLMSRTINTAQDKKFILKVILVLNQPQTTLKMAKTSGLKS